MTTAAHQAPTEQASASQSQWAMAARLIRWKDLAIAVGFFVTLFAGGVVTLLQLQAKPDRAELDQAIDDAIDQRVVPAVDLLLDEQAYQGQLLDCLAKGCTTPPPRPPEIDAKRRALVLRSRR
jgi:hypothetical protein